jgi:hypothetical protein
MTKDMHEYKRNWMRKKRAVDKWRMQIKKNHCPVCSMLLTSSYHIKCRYLDKEDKNTPF